MAQRLRLPSAEPGFSNSPNPNPSTSGAHPNASTSLSLSPPSSQLPPASRVNTFPIAPLLRFDSPGQRSSTPANPYNPSSPVLPFIQVSAASSTSHPSHPASSTEGRGPTAPLLPGSGAGENSEPPTQAVLQILMQKFDEMSSQVQSQVQNLRSEIEGKQGPYRTPKKPRYKEHGPFKVRSPPKLRTVENNELMVCTGLPFNSTAALITPPEGCPHNYECVAWNNA